MKLIFKRTLVMIAFFVVVALLFDSIQSKVIETLFTSVTIFFTSGLAIIVTFNVDKVKKLSTRSRIIQHTKDMLKRYLCNYFVSVSLYLASSLLISNNDSYCDIDLSVVSINSSLLVFVSLFYFLIYFVFNLYTLYRLNMEIAQQA